MVTTSMPTLLSPTDTIPSVSVSHSFFPLQLLSSGVFTLSNPSSDRTTLASNSSESEPIIRTQTPIFECVPASYNYTGGVAPYTIFIIRSGDNDGTIFKTLPIEGSPGTASWGVDINAGTSITFVIKDSANSTGYSTPIIVQTGKTNCLPKSPSHSGAIIGGVIGSIIVLFLVCSAIWLFGIRPRQLRKKPQPFTGYIGPKGYNPENRLEGGDLDTVLPTVQDQGRNVPAAGTFNLAEVQFNEDSLMALHESQKPPPAYGQYRQAFSAGMRNQASTGSAFGA